MSEDPDVDRDARLRALVRGRVQGVFFRDFTRRLALGLGVSGFVRNLSDGRTVEVVAEGRRSSLAELRRLLGQGPPGAYVEQVDFQWESATREFGSFRVL